MTVRAWVVAHNGVVAVAAMLLAAAALTAAASRNVATFDESVLPLGMLAPPLIAMLAGLGVVSTLPTPRPRWRRAWRRTACARALWLATVTAVAVLGGLAVATALPVPGMVAACAALTCLTYGTAAMLGRAAPLTGAAVAVVVLVNLRSFAGVGAERWDAAGWPGVLMCVGAGAGAAVYVAVGSRADTRFAG